MRLIDADWLMKQWEEPVDWLDKDQTIRHYTWFNTVVNLAPTVDAVAVIRCKDCKHFLRDVPCVGGTYTGCDWLEGMDGCPPFTEPDFFCADGERRKDA